MKIKRSILAICLPCCSSTDTEFTHNTSNYNLRVSRERSGENIYPPLEDKDRLSYPTNYYGVDVSQPYVESTFACLKGLNLQFAVIRCYQSVGKVDPACAGSTAAANAAGLDTHAYMFPDPTAGNPESQVQSLLSYWEEHKVGTLKFSELQQYIENTFAFKR